MAQILVRNLDDAVVERLKMRARSNGTSLEQEARTILTEAAQISRAELIDLVREFRAKQPPNKSRAADLIREDRDR
jgi:antitoxin FitA